jgi:hypothetical protein
LSLPQSRFLCNQPSAGTAYPHQRDNSSPPQVSCTRVLPMCTRCYDGTIECVYSRSGTIRRKRKRRGEVDSQSTSASHTVRPSVASSSTPASATESSAVQSHLTNDIETTRGLLQGLGASHTNTSLGALTSLSEACAAVWHNAMEFDITSRGYFLFEDRATLWVESENRTHIHNSFSDD